MKKPIHAILHVLQGKIHVDNKDVRLVQHYHPEDNTPCITIDDSGGTRTLNKFFTNKDLPLPENHPQYDPLEPNRLWSRQVITEKRGIDLDLNIWCNTEDERESIIKQIEYLFYLAQSDHYSLCSNYNVDGVCSTLDDTCPVLSQPHDMRGAKQQCINPEEYGYKNIFTEYDLIRSSFDVEPAYNIDDLDTENPLLRSVIRVSTDYYDYHVIGGKISTNLINKTQ